MNGRPVDPLLASIREYVNLRNEADAYVRALLAYGREIAQPRPYRLIDLAEAAGMSVNGVRQAYGPADLALARELIESDLKIRDLLKEARKSDE